MLVDRPGAFITSRIGVRIQVDCNCVSAHLQEHLWTQMMKERNCNYKTIYQQDKLLTCNVGTQDFILRVVQSMRSLI